MPASTLRLYKSQSRKDLRGNFSIHSATWSLDLPDRSSALLLRTEGGWRILPVGGVGVAGTPYPGRGVQGSGTLSWKIYQRLEYRTFASRKDLLGEIQGALLAEAD